MKFIIFLFIFCILFPSPVFSSNSNSKAGILIDNTVKWQESTCFEDVLSGYEIQNTFPDRQWWLQFNDFLMVSYIEEAVRENRDLKAAVARIEESQAAARYAFGNELPHLNLYTLFFRANNRLSGGTTSAASTSSGTNIFIAPLVARYEIDLFLKNRNKTKSAQKESEASIYDSQSVLISLTTELVTTYLNLLKVDKLLMLNIELLQCQQKALQLNNVLFQQGEIAYDDVLTTEQAVSNTLAAIEGLKKLQSVSVHSLCILMGKPPVAQYCFPRGDFDNILFSSDFKIGAPSGLVSRRPDILAAESRLKEAGINISVAKRDFFPTITAIGTFGYESVPLSSFFNLKGLLAGVGVLPSISLFSGGQKIANYNLSKARYRTAINLYQKAILAAFQEVEDSLSTLKTDYNQYEYVQKDLEDSKILSRLTNLRYENGENSLLDIINSRQKMIYYEQNIVNAKGNLLIDNISLYKALGGGY